MSVTPQIVLRARDAVERGQSVLILVTSDRQASELRRALPKGVAFAKRAEPGQAFDLTLDDR